MKRTLLLLLATGIWVTTQAQNAALPKEKRAVYSPIQVFEMKYKAQRNEQRPAANHGNNSVNRVNHVTGIPNLPFLGSADNVNGTLDATTTAVSADQASGVIVMTHRENATDINTCGTGAYVAAFSTDAGNTWDSTVNLFCLGNHDYGTRYPNGVIFNPSGGANVANMYDVMAGPYTNGASSGVGWSASVYGSITLGNTGGHQDYWVNWSSGALIQNTGDLSYMSSSDDSTVHVIGQGYDTNASGNFTVWRGAVLTTGKFTAADTFHWTQTLFRPHLVPDRIDWQTANYHYDSLSSPLVTPATAWSQDGKTGYVVILGNVDSTGYDFYTHQPIVYKTTNSGQTWTMLPLFNFRNIPSLVSRLFPSVDSGIPTPLWYCFQSGDVQGSGDEMDMTVDYRGNLHIFSAIVGSYYTEPDSVHLGWFGAEYGYIYDVYTTTATGGWQARYIDSMRTNPSNNVALANTQFDSDFSSVTNSSSWVGFGNRLQASRTTDGKHIFCTWLDDTTKSFTTSGGSYLLGFPDIRGQAYSVGLNKTSRTYKFTNTTQSYFLCVSNIALTSGTAGDTTYTVPCTIGYPFAICDGLEPLGYFYFGGVKYDDTLGANPESVKNIAQQPGFSVGPNYPNPFNKMTQFNVNLTKGSRVSVDVFNLFGQKVYSIPESQMEPGTHIMSIDGSTLSSGVYLYRVIANGYAVTQKMVIE
jgi:hypothetical protein